MFDFIDFYKTPIFPCVPPAIPLCKKVSVEGELQQLVGVLDCVQKKNEEQVLVSMRAGAMVPFPNGRFTRLAKSTERARAKRAKKQEYQYI